jgi:hypothetical protein
MTEPVVEAASSERRIANRYLLHHLLGQGGMACVYRATDLANGRVVALKQLTLPDEPAQRAAVSALFEREYHTLAQLQHPRVISVYDYGVVPNHGPYYTMELLDGGDLRDRSPLDWRAACSIAFDVCSSLALLHSRRLLHRDVSPRNIRCTHDGRAKLIDFGAMTPMGTGSGAIVGTPAFTPPEVLQRSALDARSDLFALGASIYFALTGAVPYAARNFGDLFAAWNYRPAPPSARVSGIPAELDDLVLSLLNIEPGLRPPSAFDVMQRLAAIGGLACSETESVSRAYLATPMLVARDDTLLALRGELEAARERRGSGVLIRAASGLGRTRVLDACAREAKTLGATVLRAAGASDEPFAIALGLLQHMLDTLPELDATRRFPELFEGGRLRSAERLRADAGALQRAISRFLLAYSRRHPLLIAVDDVQRIDEASAAVLAALLDRIQRGRLLIVMTAVSDAPSGALGLEVLARRCHELPLEPLTRFETRELLASVFGEVPNLEMLTGEIYTIARGNPRHSMDLAQHLVDRRAITYVAGTWTVPGVLSASELPSSVEEAITARIVRLTPRARFLAEAQALAFSDVFAHADYRALCPEVDPAEIEAAIVELVSEQALVSYGRTYALANRIWSEALTSRLKPAEIEEHHSALAEFYRPHSEIAWIHHLFAAGLEQEGLAAVMNRQRAADGSDHKAALQSNVGRLAPAYFRSIQLAMRLGRSAREVHDLRRWTIALSVAAEDSYYWDVAPAWLEQLKRDSGLAIWEASNEPDPIQRLNRALTQAHERWLGTPENERVYSVQEGVRYLAEFVACSIAIGGRSMDADLLESLPELLEPFAPLSPLIDAIWQNALATVETMCDCQFERASVRWIEVHEKLGQVKSADMQHVWTIRNAIAYGLGLIEASNGSANALRWAEYLDQDPFQKVSALYLRKVVRLQQGDWQGAEQFARRAELTALQSNTPQMFSYILPFELEAHTHARDLAGVKDVIDRLQPLAARYPGWLPHLREAEAQFELIRGDYLAAESGFEECIELIHSSAGQRTLSRAVWISAHVGLCEALLALNRPEEARKRAAAVLARCQELEIEQLSFELIRVLALAEARLGYFSSAGIRLTNLIERQVELGVSGLKLGLSYEARAQTAIWSEDKHAFEHYARLTAREYRHGAHSPLGARYESLINEARRRGFSAAIDLRDFGTTSQFLTSPTHIHEIQSAVQAALTETDRPEDRSKKALQLVCDASGSRGGHLYLVQEPETVTLAASYLSPAPPPGLEEVVQSQLHRERDKPETLTTLATSVVTEATTGCSVLLAGTVYELVLLRCAVGNRQVAGVAAIVSGETKTRHPQRQQVLAAVAAQLVRR